MMRPSNFFTSLAATVLSVLAPETEKDRERQEKWLELSSMLSKCVAIICFVCFVLVWIQVNYQVSLPMVVDAITGWFTELTNL